MNRFMDEQDQIIVGDTENPVLPVGEPLMLRPLFGLLGIGFVFFWFAVTFAGSQCIGQKIVDLETAQDYRICKVFQSKDNLHD